MCLVTCGVTHETLAVLFGDCCCRYRMHTLLGVLFGDWFCRYRVLGNLASSHTCGNLAEVELTTGVCIYRTA